jgi:hypothetical protein
VVEQPFCIDIQMPQTQGLKKIEEIFEFGFARKGSKEKEKFLKKDLHRNKKCRTFVVLTKRTALKCSSNVRYVWCQSERKAEK